MNDNHSQRKSNRGPEGHINIRILHSGSKAQGQGGFHKPWFVGSCYLDTKDHTPSILGSLCLCGLLGASQLAGLQVAVPGGLRDGRTAPGVGNVHILGRLFCPLPSDGRLFKSFAI